MNMSLRRFAIRLATGFLCCATLLANVSRGAEKLDLEAWQMLPVFHGGRVMPLDTLAGMAVEQVCLAESGRNTSKGAVKLALASSDEEFLDICRALGSLRGGGNKGLSPKEFRKRLTLVNSLLPAFAVAVVDEEFDTINKALEQAPESIRRRVGFLEVIVAAERLRIVEEQEQIAKDVEANTKERKRYDAALKKYEEQKKEAEAKGKKFKELKPNLKVVLVKEKLSPEQISEHLKRLVVGDIENTRKMLALVGSLSPKELGGFEKAQKLLPKKVSDNAYAVSVVSDAELASFRESLELFPEGKPVRFLPHEMLLSWLAESERWEDVPFIFAAHEDLRRVLEVDASRGLKYVSPREVLESEGLVKYLGELEKRQRTEMSGGGKFESTDLDKLVRGLRERYNLYRDLTLDPTLPLVYTQVPGPGTRGRFLEHFQAMLTVLEEQNASQQTFASRLQFLAQQQFAGKGLSETAGMVLTTLSNLQRVGTRAMPTGAESTEIDDPPTLEEADLAVVQLRRAAERLATELGEKKKELFSDAGIPGTSGDSANASLMPIFRELDFKGREIRRLAKEMHLSLYDNGDAVYVVPSLNAAALALNRDLNNDAMPWVNLQTIISGTDGLLFEDPQKLACYPKKQVVAVRESWQMLVAAFTNRGEGSERRKRVEAAQEKFTTALIKLSEKVDPQRWKLVEKELPKEDRDKALFGYTNYPTTPVAKSRLAHEFRYHKIDPFGKVWVINLIALVAFSLSFGMVRKPMFMLGVCVLAFGLAWSTYGFYLRVMITQWSPVTNMYETVIYVPYVVSVLGLWFMLLPICWTGMGAAWRMTSFPGFGTSSSSESKAEDSGMQVSSNAANWLVAVPRLILSAAVFYLIGVACYGDGNRPMVALLPDFAEANNKDSLNILFTWGAGMTFFLLSVWLTPRLIIASLLCLATIPNSWMQEDRAKMFQEVYARWGFGFATSAVAALGAWVAWFSPVLSKDFSPLMPVLRSNFWLTIHVLSIVSSYGAGMLAWGLGMIALCYYMFGKYRPPVVPANLPEGMMPKGVKPEDAIATGRVRPPKETADYAHWCYRCCQVAVLLLAVGTILGGLWADVSWGRFWGWDPKEVWALISFLVYVAILHGRYAGLFNNFGMIAGTVFGATAIAFSWYGVNFILPLFAGTGSVGLHSYGSGTGQDGVAYVFGFVALNLAFLAVVSIRYWIAMSVTVKPVVEEDGAFSDKVIPASKA